MSKRTITFLLGPTCSGKSTLCERATAKNKVYPVQIGKILREKYPPEFFLGQGAPAHTQQESIQLMKDGVRNGFLLNYDHILVDGQPRTPDQVTHCLNTAIAHNAYAKFLMLYAPLEVREYRAHKRHANDPKNLKLAITRLQNDLTDLIEVWSTIHLAGSPIQLIDTTKPYDIKEVLCLN